MTKAADTLVQMIDAFNRRDNATMRSLMAPGVVWEVLDAGVVEGIDKAMEYLTAMQVFPTYSMDLRILSDDGTNVVSVNSWTAVQGDVQWIDAFTGEPSPIPLPMGIDLSGNILNHVVFVDGKLTRCTQAANNLPMALRAMAAVGAAQ